MNTRDRFTEQVCIVTGGASGIGLATAERIASEGGAVAVIDVDEQALHAVHGRTDAILPLKADVAELREVQAAVAKAAAIWGPPTVLVCCAAVHAFGALGATAPEVWQSVFDVNVKGVYNACYATLPGLLAASDGSSIVNVASAIGIVAAREQSAYCVSKSAVVQLTRTIALDYGARGVRANTVAPGMIDTPLLRKSITDAEAELAAMSFAERMHVIPRLGRPEEVAAAVAFLASKDASFITGTTLAVDAGYTAQ